MKRLFSLILCLAMVVCLAACGAPAQPESVSYADQEAFLKDMAKGVSQRLQNVDDGKERTDEELCEYYKTLVGYELTQVEKYENATFEDALFDELAQEYIMGCKAQRTGAENYKKLSGLWTSGSEVRASIISYMYTEYDLPITAEEAARYSATGVGGLNITFNGVTTTEDEFDADAVRSKLEASHINGQGKHGLGATLIKNDSDEIVDVKYTVKYYQGENLVGTKDGNVNCLFPGETGAKYDLDYSYVFTKTEIDINSVSRHFFWSGENEAVRLTDMVTYEASVSGGNAVVEITNNGNNHSGYFNIVVVFCDGKIPVDVNEKSMTIDVGCTQTAVIECRNGSYFDNVQVYFSGIS